MKPERGDKTRKWQIQDPNPGLQQQGPPSSRVQTYYLFPFKPRREMKQGSLPQLFLPIPGVSAGFFPSWAQPGSFDQSLWSPMRVSAGS